MTSAKQPWPFALLASSVSSRLLFWWKGLGTLRTYAEGSFAFQSEWRTKPEDWCTCPLLPHNQDIIAGMTWPKYPLFWQDRQTHENNNCERYLEFHASSHLHLNCRIVFTTVKFGFAQHLRVHGFRLRVFPVVVFLMSGVRTIKSF